MRLHAEVEKDEKYLSPVNGKKCYNLVQPQLQEKNTQYIEIIVNIPVIICALFIS